MARTEKSAGQPKGRALVIVESPTKANTLRKFLGGEYLVEASVGHVRDLAVKKTDLPAGDKRRSEAWVHYGVNVENGFEPLQEIYLVPADKKRQVDTLKQALAQADELYLATDDDREGEAISWHLKEVLKPTVPVKRMVFHEITREAIQRALAQPRELDDHLVSAQRARRVVDRLFGWDVSQVLWRKIKPGLSAGRVQSVALRLLVQRERERMAFRSATYWDLAARLVPARGDGFDATLQRVGDQRIASGKDFDDTTGKFVGRDALLLDESGAQALLKRLTGKTPRVLKTEVKPQTLRPSAPFTTSTLQQEANRKLRFSAKQTMQVAQKLYESGYITYMRTDSTTLSEEALAAARNLIADQYGQDYLPAQPRRYQTRTANAQEAHEAIRPAGSSFPGLTEVEKALGREAGKLFELIWKRTVASQMVDAQVDQASVDIGVEDAVFRASGRTTRFPGFLKAYVEGSDDPEAALSDRDKVLPVLTVGDTLTWGGPPPIDAQRHDTKPPARLTDASLVKALEDKGIGRPSTYAAILQNLLEKAYCFRRGSSALVPTFMGMAVVQLLEEHMPHLVDYNFTAEMEARLDAIARGEAQAASYLRSFYADGFPAIDGQGPVQGLTKLLDQVRGQIEAATASSVPIGETDKGEAVVVRIGRFGTFVKVGELTATVPDDTAPDELTVPAVMALIEKKAQGDAPLGTDPTTGEPIYLRNGRFGPYLQRGVGGKEETEKPKMVSLSKGMVPDAMTLERALLQLALPRSLGKDPKSGFDITAQVGRYGDYLKVGEESRTLPPAMEAATITKDQAIEFLARPRATAGKEHVRDIGLRPLDGALLSLWTGRYGLYVSDGKTNKTLRDSVDPDALTVEAASQLLADALQARTGKVMGTDGTGAEVRLLDGRFGPYLTNGAINASLARGTSTDELTLEEALDRLKHFGKPVNTKGNRGKTRGAAAKSSSSKAKSSKTVKPAKAAAPVKPKAPAKAAPKAPAKAKTAAKAVTAAKSTVVRRPAGTRG
jgi:DNA topoisomerase-1